MSNCILKFNNIHKIFPGVHALKGITFSLDEGEVLALIGENGAGKSTLVKCLTGANIPDEGSIELFGKEYTSITPAEARKLGISAVYQEFNLVPDLPVVENVFMGNNPGNGIIVDYNEMLRRCKEIFDSFNLKIDPTINVSKLSPAMMQIVEIAKAIALDLKILILDEPTAPLTDVETEILFNIIRKIKKEGVSVLYISHRLEEIFQICDRCVVMRDGNFVAEKSIGETNRNDLISLMIGRELTNYYPARKGKPTDEIVMDVKKVTGNGDYDIDFHLKKGEILGFSGLVGAGRTELMSMLFCDVIKDSGSVSINGVDFNGKIPYDAVHRNVALLPEDRKRMGLLLDQDVSYNVTLACIKDLCKRGVIDRKKEKETIDYYCKALEVKTPSYQQICKNLSGGNQQKLIVAKWLATNSDIIIFDEPTRGIDVGAKHEIYELIVKLADEGKSIIMVSSELDEVIGIADRMMIMCEGRISGELNRNEFDKERILDLASGNR